ncbi:MAG TPA: PAS domain S-box protein, partial [Phenylobacterium sp.]|nr:PAS domain S-box protein [Phenylobacterium sp.]
MSRASTFPAGPGEAAERIRAFDWGRTSLGPITAWPQSLKTVVEMVVNTPVAMVLMWGEDHVMLYNDAYRTIAGDKHPAALGGTVPGVWPEIWDWNRPILERGLAGESMAFREQPLKIDRGKGLEDAWFDLFYTPVRDESGAVRGVLCTAPDITEQLRARGAERMHRQIVDSASDTAIISTDREGRITRWSAGAAQLLGWSEAEMRGMSLARLFPESENGEARLAEERQAALTVGRGGHEGWRRRKDGSQFWAIGEMTPLRDDSDEVVGFVKVLRDRTEQQQAQEAWREENRALEILNRAAAALVRPADIHTLVQGVVDVGVELTRAQFGAFFYNVNDEAGEWYTLYALAGAPREAFEKFPMPRNTEVFAPTFEGVGVVRSDDITADPRYGKMEPHHGMPQGHLPV